MYTRMLAQALSERSDLELFQVSHPKDLQRLQKEHAEFNQKNTVLHYPFFDLFFTTLPFFRPYPTIVTVHDVIPLKFPDKYPSGLKGSLRLKKQTFTLRGVDGVITDSVASQHDITSILGMATQKTDVVYLAASQDIQAQPQEEVMKARRALKLPKEYVLYVGDINYNKNIPQLIKMVKFLPDNIDLVCVGKNFYEQNIPEWKWIETQVALSDVSQRVHFITSLESTATQTLSALYSGAVAYIQPSLYEGFGLPVIEAMQAKCPVIASHNSSLIEVSGEHAILVEPEAEAFAAAVKEISDWSATKRHTVIKNAYNWSQTFSWQRVAEETRNIYAKVLGFS